MNFLPTFEPPFVHRDGADCSEFSQAPLGTVFM